VKAFNIYSLEQFVELYADSDKYQLRRDAQRLFRDAEQQGTNEPEWDVQYDAKYRSRRQAAYHSERDGTAFAAIALPAHYSAIYSVLHHVKMRLEPAWKIECVIDWGAGTGSGLWCEANLLLYECISLMLLMTAGHPYPLSRSFPNDKVKLSNMSLGCPGPAW
jgi:ribosomal protein RSM22 (predicted rRNA methylase)